MGVSGVIQNRTDKRKALTGVLPSQGLAFVDLMAAYLNTGHQVKELQLALTRLIAYDAPAAQQDDRVGGRPSGSPAWTGLSAS